MGLVVSVGIGVTDLYVWDSKTKRVQNKTEVLAYLVVAAVFKTVGRYVNRVFGGFDSHALPPFYLATCRMASQYFA